MEHRLAKEGLSLFTALALFLLFYFWEHLLLTKPITPTFEFRDLIILAVSYIVSTLFIEHDLLGKIVRVHWLVEASFIRRWMRQAQKKEDVFEELVKANALASDIIYNVVHELRVPITAIVGYTEMIRDRELGELNDKQAEALEKVVWQSQNLLRTINSLFEASRIEPGLRVAQFEEVNLVDLLERLRLVYSTPLKKGLTLHWDYPRDLPVLKTEGEKLIYVLRNLIENAIRFTEQGQIGIVVRYSPESKTVEFKISDTGIKIRQEDLPLIFEAFQQPQRAGVWPHGTGLGLLLVKKFTESLGGTIKIETRPDRGSTFDVTIPCERSE